MPIVIYQVVWTEKVEQRFYYRWQKAKQQGFWANVLREGLRAFVIMIAAVSASQYFGNGRTPKEIVSKLTGSQLGWILLLLFAFSLLIGVVAWYENNKRYARIDNKGIQRTLCKFNSFIE